MAGAEPLPPELGAAAPAPGPAATARRATVVAMPVCELLRLRNAGLGSSRLLPRPSSEALSSSASALPEASTANTGRRRHGA